LVAEQNRLARSAARRAADRAVFRDLVGCALASGDPVWVAVPEPHWSVPYSSFEGELMATVTVDAHTLEVSLTESERTMLLERAARQAAARDA
jgi:hypothetical protein